MKHLDIYYWSYKNIQKQNSNDYWCTTQIGVIINDKLIDIYWGWPPDREFSDGRKWTLDRAQKELDLEFIANLNDLELLTDNANWYDDVIDLTHRNTSQNLKFIRKGQKRSYTAQTNDIQNQISELEYDIEYKTIQIKSLQNDLQKLIEENVDV